jgi:hypothetical protein
MYLIKSPGLQVRLGHVFVQRQRTGHKLVRNAFSLALVSGLCGLQIEPVCQVLQLINPAE